MLFHFSVVDDRADFYHRGIAALHTRNGTYVFSAQKRCGIVYTRTGLPEIFVQCDKHIEPGPVLIRSDFQKVSVITHVEIDMLLAVEMAGIIDVAVMAPRGDLASEIITHK